MAAYNKEISSEVKKIQSSIRKLMSLIEGNYVGKFKDGNTIIVEAAIKNMDNAYESLEQTKALCDMLSNAYTNI